MAAHEAIPEIEYEALPGGSLVANLAAGAFAGIMVRFPTYPLEPRMKNTNGEI